MGSSSSTISEPCEKKVEKYLEVIKNEKNNKKTKVDALYEILLISRKIDNRYAVAAPSVLFLLIDLLKTEKGLLKEYSLGILLNISISEDTCPILNFPSWTFHKILVDVLKNDKVESKESRIDVVKIFFNMATCLKQDNKTVLTDAKLGLIGELIRVIKEDKGESRLDALEVLTCLAVQKKCCKAFIENNPTTFIPCLIDTINDNDIKAIEFSLCILENMSYSSSNCRVAMTDPPLKLIELLTKTIKIYYNVIKVQEKALDILWNLYIADEKNKSIEPPSEDLLEVLTAVISIDDDESRLKALGVMCNISSSDLTGSLKTMASPSLGLLSQLVQIIEEDSGQARMDALTVIGNLAAIEENRKIMCDPSLRIINVLENVLRQDKGAGRVEVKSRRGSIIPVLLIHSILSLLTSHLVLNSVPEDDSNNNNDNNNNSDTKEHSSNKPVISRRATS